MGSGGLAEAGGRLTVSGGTSSVDASLETGGVPEGGPTSDGSFCRFTFSVTTVSYGGRFEPHNVGAIWIEDASGTFVKTLRTWGGPRLNAALAWEQASLGNWVDAITGATRLNEGPTTGAWNCTDATEQVVREGTYSVCVEFEEDVKFPTSGIPPNYTCLSFFLGNGPAEGTWPDQAYFTSMSWTLE